MERAQTHEPIEERRVSGALAENGTAPSPPHDRAARGRACGKIILFGEHAVVYGAPAIAAGIERGATADATPIGTDAPTSTLRLGDRTIVAAESDADDLARAFAALLGSAPVSSAVHIDARCDVPVGSGLGSSAALGVAIARAIETLELRARADERPPDLDRVLARAAAWERVFHGNPSGVDAAAAAHGGCLTFTRATGARPLPLAEDLWVCIGSTGVASSTRLMVDAVARMRARKPEIVDAAVAGITSLVQNAALALEAGDLHAVGKMLDLNQMILAGLMLSTETIETLCARARSAGALGAKLTGAGGGGCVVALVASAPGALRDESEPAGARAILAAWQSAGYSGFVTRIHAGQLARRGAGDPSSER